MCYSCRYDIDGFSHELGISIDIAASLYNELINELNLEISLLKTYLSQKSWSLMKPVVHNIKGVSVNYRINDIYELAGKINTALINNSFSDIEPLLMELFRLTELASNDILEYFRGKKEGQVKVCL